MMLCVFNFDVLHYIICYNWLTFTAFQRDVASVGFHGRPNVRFAPRNRLSGSHSSAETPAAASGATPAEPVWRCLDRFR